MSSWLSAVVLVPLAAQSLSLPTQQQAQVPMGIGPSRSTASSVASSRASNLFRARAHATTCSAFVGLHVRLSSSRQRITTPTSATSTSNSGNNRVQVGGGVFGSRDCSRRRRIPPRSRRGRCVEAMDVDGPDVPGGAKGTAEMGQGAPPWQAEAGAAVERPNVEMPQPGEWLQVPMGESRPRCSSKASSGVNGGGKADPFSAPDNEYRDSWLDTLCINLLSSRMSAALKVEARVLPTRSGSRGSGSGGGGSSGDRGGGGGGGDGGGGGGKSARVDGDPASNNGARSGRGSAFPSPPPPPPPSPPAITVEGGAGQGGVLGENGGDGGGVKNGQALPAAALVEDYFAPIPPEETADRASERSEATRDRRGPAAAAAATAAAARAVMAAAAAAAGGGGGVTILDWAGGGYTYTDYVSLATALQAGPPERQREVVRGVLRSVFPAWFPAFYRTIFPPSKFSAEVNAFMCPPLFSWLVGKSELIDGVVDFKGAGGAEASKEVWRSTVKVERCRYLEASKCKGTCMNLCKLPTEAFFKEDLGMPLRMTPNFEDLSCEFAFGQEAVAVEDDPLMQEPCWVQCLNSGKQPKTSQRACHTMPESPLKR